MKALTERDGKPSSSRRLMAIVIGTVGLVWLLVGILIWLSDYKWQDFEGYLEWGKGFAFGSLAPYVANKLSKIGGNGG